MAIHKLSVCITGPWLLPLQESPPWPLGQPSAWLWDLGHLAAALCQMLGDGHA